MHSWKERVGLEHDRTHMYIILYLLLFVQRLAYTHLKSIIVSGKFEMDDWLYWETFFYGNGGIILRMQTTSNT